MTKPKLSISARILLATLVPLLFIFSIVLITMDLIIYQANTNYALENAGTAANHAAMETATVLAGHNRMLEFACRALQAIMEDPDSEVADAKAFLHNLIQSSGSDVDSVWLVLERGAWNLRERQGFYYARSKDKIADMQKIDPNKLADSLLSPWFHLPRSLRAPAFFALDNSGRGPARNGGNHGSFARPVIVDDRVAAVAGMDIAYDKALAFLRGWENDRQRNILLLTDGGVILHSSDPALASRDIADLGFAAQARKAIRTALLSGASTHFRAVSPFHLAESLYNLSPVEVDASAGRLFVLSETPVTMLRREADRATRLILCTTVVGLILLGGSVFCATRNIVKPIKRITESAQQVALGKLDAFPGAEGSAAKTPRHEVDLLENSIRSMVDQLSQTHELGIMAMEAQLEREKIAQASEAKTRFFANVSHEIRTPMNAILGMSELLLSENLSQRGAKYAGDIKLASESLLGIINDILDLSKMESGELPLVRGHYDLFAMLGDLKSLCSYLAEKKSLEFAMDVPDDLPRCLYGDNTRLRQVLLNIIGNGIKFTESGFVRLRAVNEGPTLRFDIADSGVGIRPEDIENLFHPFRQLDAERNRNIKGTGLGLSISRNLVELMDGEIWVESEYGKGSAFHIRIPAVPGNPAYIEARHEVMHAHFSDGARALIVDDNPVNLDVAAGLIGLFGLTCETAASGAEALAKVSENEYDIVFMDHMMPGMDGVEATRAIRGLGGRFEDLVIVALTANAVIGTREMFLDAGMDDFLSKPIVKEKLQAILYRWLPAEKRVDVSETLPDTSTFRLTTPLRETGKPFAERLRGVAGLNARLGLQNVGGSEEVYEGVLRKMPGMRVAIAEKLRDAFADGDLKIFQVEIHSVKGAMANIGAVRLAADAAALERAAGDGDAETIGRRLDDYLRRLGEFFESLEKAL